MSASLIIIDRTSGVPLIGSIAFGIVDRGSSLIQVRPSTACNMKCTFCSTSANDFSLHPVNYVVDPDYLLDWVREVAKVKGKLHVNIDSVGEPTAYQHLEYFIREARKISGVYFVSMQTNGTLLTKEKLESLEKAGLNRIHLSIHSLDSELSKRLFGNEQYSLKNILHAIHLIKGTSIELLLTPVWLPKVNDQDIIELIRFAKEQDLRIAIQKYEEYTHSRKEKQAKRVNFFHFYKQLKAWEKEFGVRLVYNAESLQVYRAPSLPTVLDVRDRVSVVVQAQGWMPGQMLASVRNRCVTVVNCLAQAGDRINIRILENKHNIYLAEMVKNL